MRHERRSPHAGPGLDSQSRGRDGRGDFVERWLRDETEAAVERDEHGNVFARVGEGETTLALAGHHDVVPPDDSQVAGDGEYIVEAEDGRLYGRGRPT